MSNLDVNVPIIFRPLSQPARYKIVYGGRGSAKSTSIAILLLLRGMKQKLRILCCREIQNSINDSVKRLLDDRINQYGFDDFYTSTKLEIRGKNGTNFLFMGLYQNISRVKSVEGIDVVWIEEADSISQDSLDLLIPTIRKENSELIFTFNPRKETDPVYKRFLADDDLPEGTILLKVNYSDNPYFPGVLKKEMEWDKKRDYQKYLHIWEGELLSKIDSLVFQNWKVKNFLTPKSIIPRIGMDFGFSKDDSALTRCWINKAKRRLFIDYEAGGKKIELPNLPGLLDKIPGTRIYPVTADSSRPETISYLRGKGFKMKPSRKGKGSVIEGIVFLQGYDIYIHPRCPQTIREFQTYSYKVVKKTNEILAEPEDKNNHYIDSLRYGIEVLRRAQVYI